MARVEAAGWAIQSMLLLDSVGAAAVAGLPRVAPCTACVEVVGWANQGLPLFLQRETHVGWAAVLGFEPAGAVVLGCGLDCGLGFGFGCGFGCGCGFGHSLDCGCGCCLRQV
jgi:hypothetical protein